MSTELDALNAKAMEQSFSKEDAQLLKAAENNMTPLQMEKLFRIPAAQAALRVKHLLSTQDYLTLYERKQLLLNSAFAFKIVLDGALSEVADNPKLANNYIATIRMLSDLLKEQGAISDRELAIINEAQARAIVGAVERAFYSITKYLRENNPEVNINALNAMFRQAVQEGLVSNADSE